jgi:hypothetical protein
MPAAPAEEPQEDRPGPPPAPVEVDGGEEDEGIILPVVVPVAVGGAAKSGCHVPCIDPPGGCSMNGELSYKDEEDVLGGA